MAPQQYQNLELGNAKPVDINGGQYSLFPFTRAQYQGHKVCQLAQIISHMYSDSTGN